MILTTGVKRQLLALAVATVLGGILLGNMYLRIPEALGMGRYQVTAAFTHGAQLYDGAEVTYLGRPVGKVVDMQIADQGIVVDMSLLSDVTVPANAQAEIHSRSAVGEQYVDLVPSGPGAGGRLTDGARIPVERTSTPVEIGPLLDRVGALADSLPAKDLNVLLHETGSALRGRKDDLADLIDDSGTFLSAAEADLEPTRRLLRDFEPLAEAVVDSGSEFDNAMKDLAAVTQTIKASDPTIRRLLTSTPGFAQEVTALLEALRAPLPVMLRRLSSVAEPFAVYNAGFERILSDFPNLAAVAQSIGQVAKNQLHLALANLNHPPACLEGYLRPDQWRDPTDQSTSSVGNLYCMAPADDPRVVQGARNLPCARFPWIRAATPAECERKAGR